MTGNKSQSTAAPLLILHREGERAVPWNRCHLVGGGLGLAQVLVCLRNPNLGRDCLRELDDLAQHTGFKVPSCKKIYSGQSLSNRSTFYASSRKTERPSRTENGKMGDKREGFDRGECFIPHVDANMLTRCGSEGDRRQIAKRLTAVSINNSPT